MSFLQNPHMRALFRRTGMKQFAYKAYSLLNKSSGFETKFSDALLKSICQDDCVWDVGANVGFYTQKFAEIVGPSGSVIAIEPFEAAFLQLSSAVSRYPQVNCLKLALGAENRELRVDPVGPASTANSLIRTSSSEQAEQICIRTGDGLIQDGNPQPTILKIDVEGFEEDVLWGLRNSLRRPACRGVFIEVHYTLLEQRGFLRTPARLVSMLQDLDFKTRWLDGSHLEGTRKTMAGSGHKL